MQHIKTIRWFPYSIPFHTSFITAHGVLTVREGTIVEIVTDNNLSGIGEIAPMPDFAGDDLNTALAPLPMLSSQLHGRELSHALNFLYTETPGLPTTTLAGLEGALLDVMGKDMEWSVYELLDTVNVGGVNVAPTRGAINLAHTGMVFKKRIPVNVVIGTQPIENMIACAHEAMRAGYSCIKLKVGAGDPDAEIGRIAAIRSAIGPAIDLRLDANEAWTLDEAITILSRCIPYAIQYVEQPLAADKLDDMRRLRYNVPISIAADETIYDLKSARRVLAHEAADVLVIKPQLIGGLRMGRQIIYEAAQHGVQCVITSTIESGIGITGALHLAAASPEVSLECGLATLHLLADDLLVDDLRLASGFLAVPSGSGLGIQLDKNALTSYRDDRKDSL